MKEERIFFFVQLPTFQRTVTGNFTLGNPYLQLPDDFLAPASLAIVIPVTSSKLRFPIVRAILTGGVGNLGSATCMLRKWVPADPSRRN